MKSRTLRLSILICSMMFALSLFSSVLAGYIPDSVTPELLGGHGGQFKAAIANIIGALMWIGYALSVGMLVYIGIKYIIASADDKASMKGMLAKVIIGALIIALSSTIVNIVLNIAK